MERERERERERESVSKFEEANIHIFGRRRRAKQCSAGRGPSTDHCASRPAGRFIEETLRRRRHLGAKENLRRPACVALRHSPAQQRRSEMPVDIYAAILHAYFSSSSSSNGGVGGGSINRGSREGDETAGPSA